MGCWIHIYVLVTCFYSIDRIHNWEDISSRNRQCHALMMLTTWPCRSLSLQFGSGQWYVAGPYGWFHSQQLSCHVLGIFVSVSIISIIMSQWYELYDIFLLKSSCFELLTDHQHRRGQGESKLPTQYVPIRSLDAAVASGYIRHYTTTSRTLPSGKLT